MTKAAAQRSIRTFYGTIVLDKDKSLLLSRIKSIRKDKIKVCPVTIVVGADRFNQEVMDNSISLWYYYLKNCKKRAEVISTVKKELK
jgi:hypothetical protein